MSNIVSIVNCHCWVVGNARDKVSANIEFKELTQCLLLADSRRTYHVHIRMRF